MKQRLCNTSIGVKVALAPSLAWAGLVLVALVDWMSNESLSAELSRVGGEGVDRLVSAQTVANRMTAMHQRLSQSLTWESIGMRADRIKELDDALLAPERPRQSRQVTR